MEVKELTKESLFEDTYKELGGLAYYSILRTMNTYGNLITIQDVLDFRKNNEEGRNAFKRVRRCGVKTLKRINDFLDQFE